MPKNGDEPLNRSGDRRGIQPQFIAARAKARVATQFGGPNQPSRCTRPGCNATAWSKSPSSKCWHHTHPMLKAKYPPKTPEGLARRARNMALKALRIEMNQWSPSFGAQELIREYRPRLKRPNMDQWHLLKEVRDYVERDGSVVHFRNAMEHLCHPK